jgi:hypothetical protein
MNMAAANPIQIVPLHGDALAAPVSAAQLTYRGGPLLPAVQVFTFFWGTAWEGPQAALVQQINQFFDFVLTSPLLDQLAEYSVAGMTIVHGSRTGAVILSTDPPASIADADVQALIQQEISNDSAVPQPTPNSLYFAGCTGALSVADALTSTSSHELCEAITDPIPGQGWYDDQNGEIGDICAWKTKKLGNFTVQLEWSNKTGQCI